MFQLDVSHGACVCAEVREGHGEELLGAGEEDEQQVVLDAEQAEPQ